MKSEFGDGLVYCLGLFLAHQEDYPSKKEIYEKNKIDTKHVPTLWFSGASDHLYGLHIPDDFPNELKVRLGKLKRKCLGFGHGMDWDKVKDEDVYWAIDEAKSLLLLIDKHFKIPSIEAKWN